MCIRDRRIICGDACVDFEFRVVSVDEAADGEISANQGETAVENNTEARIYKVVIQEPGTYKYQSNVPVNLSVLNAEGSDVSVFYAVSYTHLDVYKRQEYFLDTRALDTAYNFYWVFPYVTDGNGKMIPGNCTKYVFAKGVCPAVTNLRAASVTGGVRLSWSASRDAQGYLVYGMNAANRSYHYVGMTTGATAFIDKKASRTNWNFYWVYPVSYTHLSIIIIFNRYRRISIIWRGE